MNVLAFWSISVKKFLDLVKSSIFCDLLNWRIIWSSTEQHGIWDEYRGYHVIWRRLGNRNSRKQSIARQFISPFHGVEDIGATFAKLDARGHLFFLLLLIKFILPLYQGCTVALALKDASEFKTNNVSYFDLKFSFLPCTCTQIFLFRDGLAYL